MNLDERLTNCAVIGAAGKMGRGIVLVLLQEMIATDFRLNRAPSRLICIDNSFDGLATLKDYIDSQMLKFAERNISLLRGWYENDQSLVDNGEMIDAFLKRVTKMLLTSTGTASLSETNMVFEAVFENLDIKNKVYEGLKSVCPERTLFFSNTSSIPISELNNYNDLNGRLIGFHFYNPPAVQKLVEVITVPDNKDDDVKLSMDLIGRFKKLAVPSNDIAGFIGNGHFIREGLYYLRETEALKLSLPASLVLINRITQNLLLRPMGMFQLIDYVGIDVFSMICKTMGQYINEDFTSNLISNMLNTEIKGGQFGDGSQKDGFFKYERGRPTEVFNLRNKKYISIESCEKELSGYDLPDLNTDWKSLSRDPNKNEKLSLAFTGLLADNSISAKLAVKYLQNSRKIAQHLVQNKVADKIDFVNQVMMNGFYHLYGPDSEVLSMIPEAANE